MIVCFVVFANSLGGEFVYDDTRQIVRNTLIQDNSLIWKALTSDVWAFKGDGTQAASNYWRPTFTLWNIICFRLFGMSPVGWHVANVVLQSGVCVLAYSLLRRWAFTALVAFVIALVFAVHPVHVESVAWIAGSPDLLFSLAFLGSLWFATSYRESRSTKHLVLTILLYFVALGAKEIGIVCLPVYYFVLTDLDADAKSKAGENKMPLVALAIVAVAYFLIRWSILGAISRPPDDAVALGPALMSIPSMFAFYLRQIFAPVWVAINYSLTPVEQIGALNFVVPLVVLLIAIAGVIYLVRGSHKARIAAAVFLLPLIPAMNATAFPAEQLVHDRYLYLPLLGVLMLLVPLAARLVSERTILIVGCVMAALLALQTFRYNTVWANDLSLWSWTAKTDDSATTAMQLGSALSAAGRNEDAIRAYSAALTKRPAMRALLGRGRTFIAVKQYANAERDFIAALAMPEEKQEAYALYQLYEALGIAYSEQRKFDAAIKSFADARIKLPMYQAALTEKLAIVLYQSGRKDEALRELEAARPAARNELLPESKNVFLRLGMLYQEQGRKPEARDALNEFLRQTTSINEKNTLDARRQAAQLLESVK
ncbi:MAG: tetratricopeptide repeat protein [Pyrinomonadaceae bacterium]